MPIYGRTKPKKAALAETDNPLRYVHGIENVCGSQVKWTMVIPENLKTDSIGIFVPGYGGFKGSSRGYRNANASVNGQATISYGPARHDAETISRNIRAPQELHTKTIGTVLCAAALKIKSDTTVPDRKKLNPEKQHLIAHSMGGLPTNDYALANLSKVEKIDYLATVGLGSPTLGQLAVSVPSRLTKLMDSGFHQLLRPENIYGLVSYYLTHVDRTIGEARSCLLTDDREKVADITSSGVDTGYVSFEYDSLIPPTERTSQYVKRWSLMPEVGHAAPQLHPVETVGHVAMMREVLVPYSEYSNAA